MFRKPALVSLAMLCLFLTGIAQEKATFSAKGKFLGVRPSLATQVATGEFEPAKDFHKEFNPKRQDANKAVPGKGLPVGGDPLYLKGDNTNKLPIEDPILVFDAASSSSMPTDPTGAVGPNHFMNSWNSSFRVWNKNGTPAVPAASLGTIWPGETAGDPIVMYDRYADRFFISQFSFSNSVLVAVSTGPDPVNDDWYTYEFPMNSFPDYPKYSVWSDGYYLTSNKNANTASTTNVVYALEREKMLEGLDAQIVGFPLPGIVTYGFYSPLGFNANGPVAPEPGNAPIVYMQDDSWNGVNDDHLKIWTINVDWNNVNNSDISAPQVLTTQNFDGLFDGGSFENLPSPGSDLDALQATIMYMAQFRRFPNYNSCVLNFVVDLDGGDDLAGIRWYELRQDAQGEPWSIYQEGTYSQPDGLSAFCGSICMDGAGNIGLAYTTCGPNAHPALRYTGRYSTDPLGTMPQGEGLIIQGTQSPNFYRYGDYAQLTIDPIDDCTFWHIGEIFNSNTRKNVVGVFKLASQLSNDVGVISIDSPETGALTANEQVTISIRNYGLDPQSNIPVSYQVDGGTMINETYIGTIDPGAVASYTFTATTDMSVVGQTYSIWASTGLATDENDINDAVTTEVTHLEPNDVGVTGVVSPVSGNDLGANETLTVTIENFGAVSQTGFPITMVFDGGTPVTENVDITIPGQSTANYTFDANLDFTNLGDYTLSVYTALPGDVDATNDEYSTIITKEICQPTADCGFGDGFVILVLEEINNNSGCDPNGYGDYTNLTANLSAGTTHEMTVTTGYGDQHVRCWVDYNDNFVFENNEIVVNNFIIGAGQDQGTFTADIPFPIPGGAALGEHLMRAKTNWVDDVVDPCDSYEYGETEDYTVVIGTGIGTDDLPFSEEDLVVSYLGNNQFGFTLNTVSQERILIKVFDAQGRQVVENKIYPTEGKYFYSLDMSQAAAGQYLVRIGSYTYGLVEKINVTR